MKTVVITATLDTKGEQVEFVRGELKQLGVRVLVVDTGILGEPRAPFDVSREEVVKASGVSLEEIKRFGRAGITFMAQGAAALVKELYSKQPFDGIFGLGGGQNTAIATLAMQQLPVGVAKLMVSTLASGRLTFDPFVGTKDVVLMHSVVDIVGNNAILRQVLRNAAHAMAGMVGASARVVPSGRPTIAATMLGMTTPCVEHAAKLLEEHGYEVVTFHANGVGGRSLEEFAREGFFQGVLDMTTHEITDFMHNGVMGAPDRLKAASEMGLPQVVGPGAIEVLFYGPPETIPAAYRDRPVLMHNSYVSSVRLDRDELRKVASVMAERLNASRGPISVVLPNRGFSEPNRAGGPFFDPEADRVFIQALRELLRQDLTLIELDAHMNDPLVATTAVEQLLRMMESHSQHLAISHIRQEVRQ